MKTFKDYFENQLTPIEMVRTLKSLKPTLETMLNSIMGVIGKVQVGTNTSNMSSGGESKIDKELEDFKTAVDHIQESLNNLVNKIESTVKENK
jgi:uncharacterized protein YoxC